MNRQHKKHKKISAYILSLTAIFIALLAGVPSCSNREAQSEQFNNNSVGADRDHTQVHKDDTFKVSGSELMDSIPKQ